MVGTLPVGVCSVSIQSMTNTDTRIEATVLQIKRLTEAGVKLSGLPSLMKLPRSPLGLLKKFSIPLIADIHFNYKLASWRLTRV